MAKTAKEKIVAQGCVAPKEEAGVLGRLCLWSLGPGGLQWASEDTGDSLEKLREMAQELDPGTFWFISEVTPPPIASFK